MRMFARSGSEGKQEELIAGVAKAQRHGLGDVRRLIEPEERLGGLRAGVLYAQRDGRDDAPAVGVRGEQARRHLLDDRGGLPDRAAIQQHHDGRGAGARACGVQVRGLRGKNVEERGRPRQAH